MDPDPLRLVEAVYAALRNQDPLLFDRLHPAIEWDTPATLPWTLPESDGTYRGHAELKEYFRSCLQHVDDLHVEVTKLIVAECDVLALGYERGRSRSTGRSFNARFAQLWTTDGGKVTRLRGFPDTAEMAAAFS